MDNFRIPIGDVSEDAIDWIIANLDGFFSVLRTIFIEMYDGLYLVLSTPSFAVVTILIGLIALLARGWQFMLGAVLGLLVIVGVDQWENAMSTLALVIVAAFWALLIALPLGIWAAKSDGFSQVVRPVLDFLQTMPAFVYLIPALMLFRVGVAPGIVATIIFALAPGVRFTELGIRSVDSEVVEAGQAFGSSPGRILRQIQLPLALPAGMVGAGGLGGDVISSLSRLDTALGVEAGLAVVILAMILDRLTNAFGRQSGLFALFAKKRKAARTAREQQLAA
ncbi:MAG: ABC transporter permease [Glutamicibacter arilaitensis]|uniref:ABC transporter permease n=1 Tax=Glutamicibacter arilaitensis TaxID=256701 RepID=UPI003FD41DAA